MSLSLKCHKWLYFKNQCVSSDFLYVARLTILCFFGAKFDIYVCKDILQRFEILLWHFLFVLQHILKGFTLISNLFHTHFPWNSNYNCMFSCVLYEATHCIKLKSWKIQMVLQGETELSFWLIPSLTKITSSLTV